MNKTEAKENMADAFPLKLDSSFWGKTLRFIKNICDHFDYN